MAHKKAGGSTKNGRDSESKRLGVKRFGGQLVAPGMIIVRQRGSEWHPGKNAYMGRDYTVHAKCGGFVSFDKRQRRINIVPVQQDDNQTDG